MPGCDKACEISRSEQQVHLQVYLHLLAGYRFGYCIPVLSSLQSQLIGKPLGSSNPLIGELSQN